MHGTLRTDPPRCRRVDAKAVFRIGECWAVGLELVGQKLNASAAIGYRKEATMPG